MFLLLPNRKSRNPTVDLSMLRPKALRGTVDNNELPLQRLSYSITPIYRQPPSLTGFCRLLLLGTERKLIRRQTGTAWQPSP